MELNFDVVENIKPRGKYARIIKDFVKSGARIAEVVPDAGQNAINMYTSFSAFLRRAGRRDILLVRRNSRIYLIKEGAGDAE